MSARHHPPVQLELLEPIAPAELPPVAPAPSRFTFLHTADWHLGQQFHGHGRDYEHQRFLDWLLDTLEREQPDALLIAGDIFDTVNPPVSAQRQLLRFVTEATRRVTHLHIVMIAGNHDSGSRIELPAPLFEAFRTHALGRIEWLAPGQLDAQRLLIPLRDAQQQVRAWCIALPFLRPAEVTGQGEAEGDYPAAVERLHQQLIAHAEQQREPGQALIALSHAHLIGGDISTASERRIILGHNEAISAQLFPDSLAYVALGHLHKPQKVGGQTRIRYSGSPLPLSFQEEHYRHQVLSVALQGDQLDHVSTLPIPRSVRLLRLPKGGAAPLDEVLETLRQWQDDPQLPPERHPWLEIRVQLEQPQPDLRQQIEQALADKAVRLLRLQVSYPGRVDSDTLPPSEALEQLTPLELVQRTWQQSYADELPDTLREDFLQLHQAVLTQLEEEQSA